MNDIELELRVENYKDIRLYERISREEKTGHLMLAPVCRQIFRAENLVREKKLAQSKGFKKLGELMYSSLFAGDIDNAFMEYFRRVEKNENRLRLQLIFHEDVLDLADMPWEFLYRPDTNTITGFFLATHPKLVLSRYIPRDEKRPDLAVGDSLRFLVVIAQPETLNLVSVNFILEEIKKLKDSYYIDVKELQNPTPKELRQAIENGKPHILHFMGHGQFNWQEERGEIALLKADKKSPEWISDSTFAQYFLLHKPRLVLLQACQGGEVYLTDNFAGLAPQLIRHGIPAVVAMKYPVINKAALIFSEAFYKALSKGEPVDGAVQEGRREIALDSSEVYSNRDFGTPVLYMNSTDGNIMPRPRVRTKFKAEDLINSSDELEAAIDQLLNLEELLNLAFGLRVNYNDLDGDTKLEKIGALIEYLDREGDRKSLIEAIQTMKRNAFT